MMQKSRLCTYSLSVDTSSINVPLDGRMREREEDREEKKERNKERERVREKCKWQRSTNMVCVI